MYNCPLSDSNIYSAFDAPPAQRSGAIEHLAKEQSPSVTQPMKTRDTEPDCPMDMVVHFIFLPIVLVSYVVTQVMLDRGWLWMTAYWLGVVLVCIGGFQMFRAKLPLYKEGRFFAFGTRGMSYTSKAIYFSALRWLTGGCAVTGWLLVSRFSLCDGR